MPRKQVYSDKFFKTKHLGKVYTPDYLVECILNQGKYVSGNILRKHVVENSCGNGQFLIHIIDRYCKDFLNISKDTNQLKSELEKYIHAIEIDANELKICKTRCDTVAETYGVSNVQWDFMCSDALTTNKYDGLMDFVLGNPPYVRVHNLNESFQRVKGYSFGNGGMTDLFIVFYEIGLKMLNKTGVLCYITPSSFFTSIAALNMRTHLILNNLIESVCDLKHFQPFHATTYTAIVCLNKAKKSKTVEYYEFDENNLCAQFVSHLEPEDYWINQAFYFSTKENLQLLKNIFENDKISDIQIKNGFATLADKCFVKDFDFKSRYIIPVLKASKAKWTSIFYPYDENSKLISEEELKKDVNAYKYILSKKPLLLNRDSEKDTDKYWYAFGRSQAISDTYHDKLSINALIRTSKDLKIVDVPAGSGVYSGLYIISDSVSAEIIKTVLQADDFGVYVSLLGKYKSGGYYTFSSKDVKFFLDYKLGNEDRQYVKQCSIFDCC